MERRRRSLWPIGLVACTLLAAMPIGGCGSPGRATAGTATVRSAALEQLRAQGFVTVALPTERPPFAWVAGSDAHPVGFDVELARILAAALLGPGGRMEIAPPSAAAEADLTMGSPPGPATTRPYYTGRLGLLVRRGSHIATLGDLDGRPVAVERAGTVGAALLAAGQAASAHPLPRAYGAYLPALADLGAGRVEAVAGPLPILRALQRFDPNTRLAVRGWGEVSYAVAAPADLLPAVEEALGRAIADEPAWQRLQRRWALHSP